MSLRAVLSVLITFMIHFILLNQWYRKPYKNGNTVCYQVTTDARIQRIKSHNGFMLLTKKRIGTEHHFVDT